MKRYITVLLTALLLCGCGTEPQPETTLPPPPSETQAVTETTVPVVLPEGLYDPDSYLEKLTGGAVQVYPLYRKDAVEVVRMGEDLLLFSGENATTLTKLSVTPVTSALWRTWTASSGLRTRQ